MWFSNRAWCDTEKWHEKETKMFRAYVDMFTSKIYEIFDISTNDSGSFDSVVKKLRSIMEKRHYVRKILLHVVYILNYYKRSKHITRIVIY